ncbi:hypothetical protein [Streptomyces candidus]|uniref:ATP synthase protein I n=1 Tax=Streptomyces candidus TaxID=67283 RepID=A0A7X0HHC1_9ACTN|nr:hypothetical protein [Streptomyces candidus]MBB6437591.1 ATP synthase protein I [Streptomyces candidus]GHH53702.1 ATP synthase protein I [Streptomyces candidus]
MPSHDVRSLLQTAVPTAALGVVAAVVGGVVVGGKGAVGAAVGVLVVILFMGLGQLALQYVAKAMPQLFSGMGLVVYSVQLVLLLLFIMAFRNTTLFHLQAFAISLVAATIMWIVAQTWSHVKSKTLYVDPSQEDVTASGAGTSHDK